MVGSSRPSSSWLCQTKTTSYHVLMKQRHYFNSSRTSDIVFMSHIAISMKGEAYTNSHCIGMFIAAAGSVTGSDKLIIGVWTERGLLRNPTYFGDALCRGIRSRSKPKLQWTMTNRSHTQGVRDSLCRGIQFMSAPKLRRTLYFEGQQWNKKDDTGGSR